jgi:hypothetical protein
LIEVEKLIPIAKENMKRVEKNGKRKRDIDL